MHMASLVMGVKKVNCIQFEVQGIRGVTTISAGDNHTITLKDDGTVLSGRNASGSGTKPLS